MDARCPLFSYLTYLPVYQLHAGCPHGQTIRFTLALDFAFANPKALG